ncbi:DNA-binding protein [Paenibacillus lutimineralis]|uniref:DNA-binding protein n=2 Tax=Paenibacillus lutimineralis TaxID=2707005 RepID=A0A3Q9IDC5_9BACL|nr:DNA-binding protein [Paenibacillus lutimineralis]
MDFDVELLQKMINTVVADAVDKAIERHAFKNTLPPVLTKEQLMDLLDIKVTKTTELLNREDFPVTRELGRPRVLTHLLLLWIEDHTDWVRENVGEKSRLKKGVA